MQKSFFMTKENRREVMPRLGDYLRSIELDNPARIRIDEKQDTRSQQQNRRLHKIIGMCSKEAGYSIEEMKFTFKRELLSPETWVEYKGRKVPLFKSTAAMRIGELNEFMEGVENIAAEWYSVVLADE